MHEEEDYLVGNYTNHLNFIKIRFNNSSLKVFNSHVRLSEILFYSKPQKFLSDVVVYCLINNKDSKELVTLFVDYNFIYFFLIELK